MKHAAMTPRMMARRAINIRRNCTRLMRRYSARNQFGCSTLKQPFLDDQHIVFADDQIEISIGFLGSRTEQ